MVLARSEADAGAPHGTLVLAEEQTAGRGRHGRSFFSPPAENLYFTLILRTPLDVHRRLPMVMPLAVVEAIRAEGIDARIKWPNDIWIGERKVCGMLIDAEIGAEGGLSFVGIGINVNGAMAANVELRDIAISMAEVLGHPVSRERLLARICNEVQRALEIPAQELSEAYRLASMILGRRVTVQTMSKEPYEALALSVDDDGALRVRRDDGTEETLVAADVSVRPGV